MTSIKKMLVMLLAAASLTPSLMAQGEKKHPDYPYMFIGVQGGGQTTFTNYSAGKLITPIGAVSVGGMFAPAVGARIHVSGLNEKGGLKSLDQTYDYKFVTSDLDLMLNLSHIISPSKEHWLNAYLIGGVGLGCAWDNADLKALAPAATENNLNLRWDKNRLTHNFRVGMQFDAAVHRNIGVNLEVTANNYHDRFNSKLNGKGDWQLQALLGVSFKFGFKKKAAPAPAPVVVAPKPEPKPQPKPEPKPEPKPVVKPEPKPEPKPQPVVQQIKEKKQIEVFFGLNKSVPTATEAAKIEELAKWLKEHPEAKVQLNGYADAGTGNAAGNKRISQRRVSYVKNSLVKTHGIDVSRISTDYSGDTVQPYKNNDSNRVVVGTTTEVIVTVTK